MFVCDSTRDELRQLLTSECVSGSAVQSREQHLVECEVASAINSLPLCCIFVWLESLVLMISPAAFVHLSQTKPMRVNWLLPTQAMCNTYRAQRENNQCYQLLGVISENMHPDNNIQLNCRAEEVFKFFWLFLSLDHRRFISKLNSEAFLLLFNF